jgi:hypothetical protein
VRAGEGDLAAGRPRAVAERVQPPLEAPGMFVVDAAPAPPLPESGAGRWRCCFGKKATAPYALPPSCTSLTVVQSASL